MVSVLSLVFLLACGEQIVAGARLAFASAKPIIDRQVAQGRISKELGDTIKADIGDAIDAAAQAEIALKAIPANLTKPQRLVKQAFAYDQLAKALKAIRDRHHVAGDPVLDEIAGIVDDVIAALDEFFRNVVTVPEAEARGEVNPSVTAQPDPGKQLEQKMKSAQKRMKALQ